MGAASREGEGDVRYQRGAEASWVVHLKLAAKWMTSCEVDDEETWPAHEPGTMASPRPSTTQGHYNFPITRRTVHMVHGTAGGGRCTSDGLHDPGEICC